MANLLMLVIVVFLSALLFVWATASFSAYQGGAGYWFSSKSLANQERISVEYVGFDIPNRNASVYVRNVGSVPFNVAAIYLNSTLETSTNLNQQVNINQVFLFKLKPIVGPTPGSGDIQTVTLATTRGTTITVTWVA